MEFQTVVNKRKMIRSFLTDKIEDEKNSMDHVQVAINSEDMMKFISNEAY